MKHASMMRKGKVLKVLPILRLTIAAGITWSLAAALPAFAQKVETAPSVDLNRYAGRWYEIARLPNSFQKQCIGYTTADYRPMEDNKIEVVNRCKMASGSLDLVIGEARVKNNTGNAQLQVRFAPAWLSWLPWVWGDYWILEVDKDYSVATVGSPDRNYLWILSRTPSISQTDYENRVDNATKQGFDTARLIKTKQ